MSRSKVIGLLAIITLVPTACGTRTQDEGAAPGRTTVPAPSPGAVPGPPDAQGDASAQAGSSIAPTARTNSESGDSARPSEPAGTKTTGPARGPISPSSADGQPAAPLAAAPATPGQPAAGQPAGGSESATTTKSPAVIANVGTYSGPAGVTLAPIGRGVQLWARYINTKGGLNGHAVNLIVYDDGGDPARHRAQVQEAIEHRHAIAFVSNVEGVAGNKGTAEYITSKGVPVLGSEGTAQYFYELPMMFPQQSHGTEFFYGHVAALAAQAVPLGEKDLGVIVCAEANECAVGGQIWTDAAPSLGFRVAYQARASIAAPDFTAECLAAKRAGATALIILLDGNSLTRIANSCARQNYHPQWGTASSIGENRHKDDPNLEGLVVGANVFPYFQTGTPATDEFHSAVREVGGGVALSMGLTTGWVGGKLLERAGRSLSEPPTSASLLAGLWSIKDDRLGGLTLPLTFVEKQPAAPMACWFTMAIKDARWTSPDNFKLSCRQ